MRALAQTLATPCLAPCRAGLPSVVYSPAASGALRDWHGAQPDGATDGRAQRRALTKVRRTLEPHAIARGGRLAT